jgi:hypothetical protein
MINYQPIKLKVTMKKLFISTIVLCLLVVGDIFSQSVSITPSGDEVLITKYGGSIFGSFTPNMLGRIAGGTSAAPTATPSGYGLLNLGGQGYTGTAFTSSRALLNFSADQTFSPTAQGTRITFSTTLNGTTTTSERMRIDNTGKVGIGAINPLARLQITHDGADTDPHLRLHTTGSFSRINWTTATNANVWTAQSYLESATTANNYWRLEYGGTPYFYVKGDGDVGIGTSTPDTKLQVVGSENDGTTASLKITSGAQSMLFDGNEIDALSTGLYLNHNTALNVILATGGGNVGIGTTTPNNKLDVNGVVRANEVIVETGWADYVFNEDYNLKPLEEVEAFIKENKHLPSLPSASNIQDKGAHVAELMTKMMEKIEELTLYSIQQKKEIDALKKRLDEKK